MNILFVLEYFHPYVGGSEKLFELLTQKLVQKGYKITVITTKFNDSLTHLENFKGVEIIRLNLRNRFLFTFFSIPKIVKEAKKASIIHTTTYNAAFPAFIAGFLAKKKVIVTFHEVWGKLWYGLPYLSKTERFLFSTYERLLLKLPFAQFIAVSQFTKNALIANGVPESRVIRIYNGVEYVSTSSEIIDEPNETFSYIYYGRLGVSKGLDILLDAAQMFNQKNKAVLKMVTPTTPRKLFETIKEEINKKDLAQYIELHHNLGKEQLNQLIDDASCVVIPSYSEGFCFVAAEAVAKNKSIISSGKGALKEVVSGNFIEMEELDATSLVQALYLAKAKKWQHIPVKRFELATCVDAYMENYERILLNSDV